MVKEAKHITFEELASDLPGVLDRLAQSNDAIVVERGDAHFRIERTTEAGDMAPKPDPAQVREMLRRTAGAFEGIDKASFMRDLRAGRQQSSRGRPG